MTKDEALRLALEALYGFIPYLPLEHDKPQCDRYDQVITAIKAALEAKDEPVNDELRRLHDLLGKANALARIRAAEIESMKASLYGLYELEKQRDELEQRLTKTEARLGEAVWNYGELKREQLANQQNTSGSPIFLELHCICGAEWEWRNRDWELVATPPQRTWVGLTEEELKPICAEWRIVYGAWMDDFAKDIEAKLKEEERMKRIDQWKAKLKVAKAELRIRNREANAAIRALMHVQETISQLESKIDKHLAKP
jgi:hypothetical protein